jgi:hypothetical protein
MAKRLGEPPAKASSISRGEPKSRALLFNPTQDPKEQKTRATAVTRKLALLRGHALIKKLSGTHRYVLTEKGSTVITALLTARHANIDELTRIAA